MCQKAVYSRLNSGNAGKDDDLRAGWDLRVGHTSTREESYWCKWVYAVKLNANASLASLKVRLVAKRYSHVYYVRLVAKGYLHVYYVDTFSPITKMTSVRILVSLAVTYHWPLHQLDIKNVSKCYFWWGGLHRVTTGLCCSERMCKGL